MTNAAAANRPEPKTDAEIIAKHAPGVRARARLELQIVNKLIECAIAAGYKLEIVDGEDDDSACQWWAWGVQDFKTVLFDLDQAHVIVRDSEGRKMGWALLIFGNSWDLISDYGVRLEEFLKPVNDLADSLQ
jgi:hypothetical protein